MSNQYPSYSVHEDIRSALRNWGPTDILTKIRTAQIENTTFDRDELAHRQTDWTPLGAAISEVSGALNESWEAIVADCEKTIPKLQAELTELYEKVAPVWAELDGRLRAIYLLKSRYVEGAATGAAGTGNRRLDNSLSTPFYSAAEATPWMPPEPPKPVGQPRALPTVTTVTRAR